MGYNKRADFSSDAGVTSCKLLTLGLVVDADGVKKKADRM